MHESAMIGARVRALRLSRKMTLKQLSDKSGLSVGFLSQLERGMSSIAIDSLATLATALGVALSSFFHADEAQAADDSPVMRGYDLQSTPVSPQIIQYVLGRDLSATALLPRLFLLQPQPDGEDIALYSHEGEEFIYILEGSVTVYLDAGQHVLYPGDSIYIQSQKPHNWANKTNMPARLLSINYPNPFHE